MEMENCKTICWEEVQETLTTLADQISEVTAEQPEVLLVHPREYVDDLLGYRHTHRTLASELPITKEVIDSYFLATGGTVLACRLALEHGRALNLTGGFHHCFAAKAEGFCYLHDFAVGIRRLEGEGKVRRTAVIDCDLHQGNGTAAIFAEDPDVYTFSIHQENLYPQKQRSDLDIGLGDFDRDDVYMDHIRRAIPQTLDGHRPDLVVYEAGADPFAGDQLGTLRISKECLHERDRFVVRECAERGIPIAGVLGGEPDEPTLDYVAQFLCGVARSANDLRLEEAARALAHKRALGQPAGSEAATIAGMIQIRLTEKIAI